MAETTKTLAPPEAAPPTPAKWLMDATQQPATAPTTSPALSAMRQTPPVPDQASSQRAFPQRPATNRPGAQVQYFEALQQAAGNYAVGRMMTQRPASPATPPMALTPQEAAPRHESIVHGAPPETHEQAPTTPVARAQAEETAIAHAETAARSNEPEFAQSVEIRVASGAEPEAGQAPVETEAVELTAEGVALVGENVRANTENIDMAELAQVGDAAAELERTGEQLEVEEAITGKEGVEAVAPEPVEALPPAFSEEVDESKAQATVDAAIAQLMRPMAETAAIGAQPVRFAPRATERSSDVRAAQQAAQKRAASEAVVASFIARNVHHITNLSAYGMAAAPRIMAAAAVVKASIDAAVAMNTAAVTAQIGTAIGQVITQAGTSKTLIYAQSNLAIAMIQLATLPAKSSIEKGYTDTKSALDAKETDQLSAVANLYTTWKPKYAVTGTEVGDEAIGIARQKANNWLSMRNGKSTILDGPLHDNRLKARADAAIKVAQAYKKEFQKSAGEQANKVTDGKPAVLEAIRQKAGEARTNLEAHRKSLIDTLTNAETAAKAQITGIMTSLIAGVDAAQAATLASLAAQQTTQITRIHEYGARQKGAIDEQAAQAVAALMTGTSEAVIAYNNALRTLSTDAVGSEVPDAPELFPILALAQIQADDLAANALLQLELGVLKSIEGISSGGTQSTEAVNQLGQNAIAQAASMSAEFTARTMAMSVQALEGFTQLQAGHTKMVTDVKTRATEGFEQAKKGLTETFTAIHTNVNTSLSSGCLELKNALRREGLKTLDKTIQEEADKAAAAVQPRWKKVVKALITIVVVIAVIALTIVTAGAGGVLGTILIGAALGGLAGATIQVGHNLVDEKKWSDGVGKAFVVGAIGGAFGGLGGALAKGAASTGLRFAMETGTDVIGGIVGDLVVGNPITLEGILIGAAIGAGVGGGLAIGSALKGKIKIKPQVEVPTPGVGVSVTAPASRAGAPQVAAPSGPKDKPVGVPPAPVVKGKPAEVTVKAPAKAEAPEAPTAKPPTPEVLPAPPAKTPAPETPTARARAQGPEPPAPKATPESMPPTKTHPTAEHPPRTPEEAGKRATRQAADEVGEETTKRAVRDAPPGADKRPELDTTKQPGKQSTARELAEAARNLVTRFIQKVIMLARQILAGLGFRRFTVESEGAWLILYGIRSKHFIARFKKDSLQEWLVGDSPLIEQLRRARASLLGKGWAAAQRGDVTAAARFRAGAGARQSEKIGEAAADAVIQTRFPAAGVPVYQGKGPYTLDLVYEASGGRMIVIEAKGGAGKLGEAVIGAGRRAQQGTEEYLRHKLQDMINRGGADKQIAEKALRALDNGRLRYFLSETPKVPSKLSEPLETKLREFSL